MDSVQPCKKYLQAITEFPTPNGGHYLIIASRVAVSQGDVSLWGSAVSVSAPGSDESGEVTILLTDRDTVVSIPGIKYGFLLAMRYRSRLVKW